MILWLLVVSIDEVQEGVSRQNIGVSLGAALGIDGACDVRELAEYVEAVEHDDPLAFEEGTGKAGVPYDIVCVEVCIGIARTAIKREVGREVELPGKVNDGVRTDAILPSRDVLERHAVARIMVVCHV